MYLPPYMTPTCAFLLFIVGICVPIFYISIGIVQILPDSGIRDEYNNQDFHLMFLGGFYLIAAFLVRDNARDLKSMQKIIGFGQEYPKILATQPSKIEAMLGYYQRFSNRYLSLIRK